MLDFITINARINAIEALIIRNEATFKSASYGSSEMFTNELKDDGISEVNVWVNLKSMFCEPIDNKNCTINATIRAGIPNKEGGYDFLRMVDIIEAHLPMEHIASLDSRRKSGLEWKVQSASFSYSFTGLHIKRYFGFLKSGFDLKNMHLEKSIEKVESKSSEAYRLSYTSVHKREVDNGGIFIEQKSHSEIRKETKAYNKMTDEEKKEERLRRRRESRKIYDSLSLEVEYDFDPPKGYDERYYSQGYIAYVTERPKKNFLQVKINLRKAKIRSLCSDYGIKDRSIEQFSRLAVQIDADVFDFYIGRIAGSGDYYKLTDAEEIIRESDYPPMKKNRMLDAMRGIALYKGIDNFLNHTEDGTVTYPCMENLRKREHGLEAVRNLQNLGINPVSIPVRERILSGRLPNLQDYYVDVTGIEPGKVRQEKREIDKEKRKRRKENQKIIEEQRKLFDEQEKRLEAARVGQGRKGVEGLALDKDVKPMEGQTAPFE